MSQRNDKGEDISPIVQLPRVQVESCGPTDRKGVEVADLWLVAEKWEESEVVGEEAIGTPQ